MPAVQAPQNVSPTEPATSQSSPVESSTSRNITIAPHVPDPDPDRSSVLDDGETTTIIELHLKPHLDHFDDANPWSLSAPLSLQMANWKSLS